MSTVTIETTVNSNIQKAWDFYSMPEHVVNWNFASDDWECSKADNDLREGCRFTYTMNAKDNSNTFDFGGTYTEVVDLDIIQYTLDDDRQVVVSFEEDDEGVLVTVSFETEDTNTVEQQRLGWQAILDNFKKYVESK